MSVKPTKAMVLAAGLGVRMRPLTDRMPKPLVRVAGRALLDHVLDKLGDAGATEAVVNVHYLRDQIIDHVAARARPRVIISDERDEVLGTGGGVVKALPLLGSAPFFHVNADTLWIDGVRPTLGRVAQAQGTSGGPVRLCRRGDHVAVPVRRCPVGRIFADENVRSRQRAGAAGRTAAGWGGAARGNPPPRIPGCG